MNIEYQFELTVSRLVLTRSPASQGLFRITLIEATKEIDPSSTCFQTEQAKILKGQKTVEVSQLNPFKFSANKSAGPGSYMIKFQVKNLEDNHVHSVPLHISKAITEFKEKQRTNFQETFESKDLLLEYRISISSCEQKGVEVVTAIQNDTIMQEEEKSEIKPSNDKEGRMRKSRPPELNILKKSQHKSRAISLDPDSKKGEELKDIHTPQLTAKESQDELNSSKGLRKKASSLPLSEIQKVNELLATHHREEESNEHSEGISYKLKIVFFMVILGIVFLLYDTIVDGSKRRADLSKPPKKKSPKNKKKSAKIQQNVKKATPV